MPDSETEDAYSSPSEITESSSDAPQVKTKKAATKSTTKTKSVTQTVSNVVTAESQFIITKIDDLTSKGIAQADLNRLKESGIQTVQALAMQTHKQLSQVKGISEAKVDKLLAAAKELLAPDQFITAEQVLQKRQNLIRISTGSAELNNLLQGGVESQQICEVFGEFRCGKSQLCHTMAVTGQHPMVNGKPSNQQHKVIYIDTEATFRPERIQQIARRFSLNEKTTLENIIVSRVYNHEQQMAALSYLPQILVKDKFSLIIIDSITALFRADFTGRGELADRQQKLGQHLSQLIKLAEEYNIVVFITNQVMAMVDGAAMFQADPKKPIGGHILAHASTTRLSLRKGRGETRVAKVYDSPMLPEGEAVFQITEGGVDDANE
ncbi:Rad51_protein [Hexamita inflata]|uniref:Rad51 protein n=1 Tax=Hexamita inflata TaxID=28002 RepID=A0AA86ULA7_9EUKA|nr:Rad51 protein [Hexamita inflata]CAI9952325.1 Rad51 protein [Hexamita inflata]CAI9962665.1 Rad51 protein [Hexamita inflata]